MSLPDVYRECGIPKSILYEIARSKNQKCAFKKDLNKRGKFWFDTDRLAKELEKRLVRM